MPRLVDRAVLNCVQLWGLYGGPLFVAPTAVCASHAIH